MMVDPKTPDVSAERCIEKYRAIIFDCDDTVLETALLRWSVLMHTADSFGVNLEQDTIRASWGKPFPQLIEALVPELDYDEFVTRYRSDMLLNRPNPTRGAVRLLEYSSSLQQFLQIVTSSSKALIMQDLQEVGLERYFDEIYGHEETKYHKPDPRVLEAPLQSLADHGIQRSAVVYIGDSGRDYSAAVGNDIAFICVLTGLESREDVIAGGVSPSAIINDLTALLPNGHADRDIDNE
jgi:phosphoglycolate phosphatase-like HAD superfamily hydrolase